MKILIRLPNWLGDVVMALPIIRALKTRYPIAVIDVVIKENLKDIMVLSKEVNDIIPFSKEQYKGLSGIRKFGKELKANHNYDIYISCPNSFSAALMGYYSGAKQRVGYKTEFRKFLLTDALSTKTDDHRSLSYLSLLRPLGIDSINEKSTQNPARLSEANFPLQILFNINSEADSRRLPLSLAKNIIDELKTKGEFEYVFTGVSKEENHINALIDMIPNTAFHNLTGKTNLPELIEEIKSVDGIITTDSGLAHLGNYMNVPTLVIFGAGDDKITRPSNPSNLKIVRKKGLSCAPCVSNTCALEHLNCLNQLDARLIADEFLTLLKVK